MKNFINLKTTLFALLLALGCGIANNSYAAIPSVFNGGEEPAVQEYSDYVLAIKPILQRIFISPVDQATIETTFSTFFTAFSSPLTNAAQGRSRLNSIYTMSDTQQVMLFGETNPRTNGKHAILAKFLKGIIVALRTCEPENVRTFLSDVSEHSALNTFVMQLATHIPGAYRAHFNQQTFTLALTTSAVGTGPALPPTLRATPSTHETPAGDEETAKAESAVKDLFSNIERMQQRITTLEQETGHSLGKEALRLLLAAAIGTGAVFICATDPTIVFDSLFRTLLVLGAARGSLFVALDHPITTTYKLVAWLKRRRDTFMHHFKKAKK